MRTSITRLVIMGAIQTTVLLGCFRLPAGDIVIAQSPNSLVVNRTGVWYDYGMVIDGESGVVWLRNGMKKHIRGAGRPQVDQVTAVGETVWYRGLIGDSKTLAGEIGVVQADGLHPRAQFKPGFDQIAYDGSSRRLYFVSERVQDFGWLAPDGALHICTNIQPPSRTLAGLALRIASYGGNVWVYSQSSGDLYLLGSGCDIRKRMRAPAENVRYIHVQLAAGPNGSVWVVPSEAGSTIIAADSSGRVHYLSAPHPGVIEAIGTIEGELCLVAHAEDYIACLSPGGWRSKALPLDGTAAAFAAYRGTVWLAYDSLNAFGLHETGAIAHMPLTGLLSGSLRASGAVERDLARWAPNWASPGGFGWRPNLGQPS